VRAFSSAFPENTVFGNPTALSADLRTVFHFTGTIDNVTIDLKTPDQASVAGSMKTAQRNPYLIVRD
jgi:hypothetical protein